MLSISAIEAKFKRAKLQVKSTFLYSKIDDLQKKAIHKRIEPNEGEQFVIFYINSSNYSWLMSNKRLIILNAKVVGLYPYEIIKSIELPEIENLKKDKTGTNSVSILLVNGDMITLSVENTAWHFVYEILKFLLPD